MNPLISVLKNLDQDSLSRQSGTGILRNQKVAVDSGRFCRVEKGGKHHGAAKRRHDLGRGGERSGNNPRGDFATISTASAREGVDQAFEKNICTNKNQTETTGATEHAP